MLRPRQVEEATRAAVKALDIILNKHESSNPYKSPEELALILQIIKDEDVVQATQPDTLFKMLQKIKVQQRNPEEAGEANEAATD